MNVGKAIEAEEGLFYLLERLHGIFSYLWGLISLSLDAVYVQLYIHLEKVSHGLMIFLILVGCLKSHDEFFIFRLIIRNEKKVHWIRLDNLREN